MKRLSYGIIIMVLGTMILGTAVSAHQRGWPGKRLSQTFPGAAKFTSRQVTLTMDQIGRIEQAIGERVEPENRVPTFYPAFNKAGEKIGFVLFADQVGENGPIEMGVAVDSQGKVQRVMIFTSREDKRIAGEEFLSQFQDKTVKDLLKTGADINAVAGAEKASQTVVTGVRKVLLIKQEAFNEQNP